MSRNKPAKCHFQVLPFRPINFLGNRLCFWSICVSACGFISIFASALVTMVRLWHCPSCPPHVRWWISGVPWRQRLRKRQRRGKQSVIYLQLRSCWTGCCCCNIFNLTGKKWCWSDSSCWCSELKSDSSARTHTHKQTDVHIHTSSPNNISFPQDFSQLFNYNCWTHEDWKKSLLTEWQNTQFVRLPFRTTKGNVLWRVTSNGRVTSFVSAFPKTVTNPCWVTLYFKALYLSFMCTIVYAGIH